MRKLTITSKNVIKQGTGNKGPWTLYGIEALDENGEPIAQQLKTFSDLPLGEVQVDVEAQHHEQYGTSYLLKPAGGGGGGGGARGGDISALERRIAALERDVRRISGIVDRRDADVPATHQLAGAITTTTAPGIPDDDIPF